MTTKIEQRQQHRDTLKRLIAEARTRDKSVDFSGKIGAYCDNENCEVRQVEMTVLYDNGGIVEVACPACRRPLLLGDYNTGIAVATFDESADIKGKLALHEVYRLLKEERAQATGERLVVWNLSEIMDDPTLDVLAALFRERDTFFAASGSSPGVGAK